MLREKTIRALRDELREMTARLGETSDEVGDEEVPQSPAFAYACAVADALDWVLGESAWTVSQGPDGATEVADTAGYFDELRDTYSELRAVLPEESEG
jgi:hypothetical protein